MQCAEHPKVETVLRCGKCDKPICPRCMVQTPVGARCKACAQLKRLPIFDVSTSQHALAIVMGAFLAAIIGVAWAFIAIPFISFWIPIGVGYLVGEVISLSVNRKRSVGLQIIAGLSIFAAYVFSRLVPSVAYILDAPGIPLSAGTLVQLSAAIVVGTMGQPFILLILGLGIYIGVRRVR